MKRLFLFLKRRSRLKLKHHFLFPLSRRQRRSLLLLFMVLLLLSISILSSSSWFAIFLRRSEHSAQDDSEFDSSESNLFRKEKEADRILSRKPYYQRHYNFSYANVDVPPPPPTSDLSDQGKMEMDSGPYHNWQLFSADFEEMMRNLKIYVYPCIYQSNSSSFFAAIFLPHPNPFHPKLGNYFSEHMFKVALLRSSLITSIPEEAHLFFLPFSVNLLRSDPRVHSESSISKFVTQYTTGISRDFPFWNASSGADHFYVCCHSVCREASSKHHDLHNNAIQVTCSSSYFQRYYITHKDVGFPQVWPRLPEQALNPPDARYYIVKRASFSAYIYLYCMRFTLSFYPLY